MRNFDEVAAHLGSSSSSTVLDIFPVSISTLSLGQSTATGGSNVQATITLSGPAPVGELEIALSSDNGSATVPGYIYIPSGATTYSFLVKTSAVSSSTTATLSASIYVNNNNAKRPIPPQATAKLQILPATVSSLVCAVPNVMGGANAEVQVGISGMAGPSGDVVTLSSSNGAVILPASVTIPSGASTMWFLAKTSKVTSTTKATLTATTGAVSKTASLTVTAAAVTGISATPDAVTGGASVETTVTLGSPAGTGGTTVNLSSSNAAAPVPASVNVIAGASSYSFLIKTQGVTSSVSVTLTASVGSANATTKLTINPVGIASVSVTPGSVKGGTSVEAVVTLNGLAPPGGAVVSLSSTSANILVPATITVPAGANHYSFAIKTTAVAGSAPATITAKLGNTFGTANVTVTP